MGEEKFISGNTAPLQARIEKLEAENFQLASWQCLFLDGKKGIVCHETGGQYCQMERENKVLHKMFENLAVYLHVHGIDLREVKRKAQEALGVTQEVK